MMNELKGTFINIILSIDTGRGFDALQKNSGGVLISANFNKRTMETDCVAIGSNGNVVWNTEIVWESEKKLLRKARGAYSRVRVEVYTAESRQFVGFCMMCLRSAKILPSSRTNLQLPYAWNKLLNVPKEYRKYTPELNICVTIRDYFTNHTALKRPLSLTTTESATTVQTVDEIMSTESVQVPVKYIDDGFTQVGSDDESELAKFQFKITLRNATNLDLLLTENVAFGSAPKNFYITLAVFGMKLRTRHIQRELHEVVNVNETIVINIISKYELLRLYFEQYPNILATFYNHDEKLGWASIGTSHMGWRDVDEGAFEEWCKGRIEAEEQAFFENGVLRNDGILVTRRPSLTARCTLELMTIEPPASPQVIYSPGVDNELLLDTKRRPRSSGSHSNKRRSASDAFMTNLSMIEKCKNVTLLEAASSPTMLTTTDNYNQYCLGIIIDSLIWHVPYQSNNLMIEFQHPQTPNVLKIEVETKSEKRLLLENVICRLIFICGQQRLKVLLETGFVAPYIRLKYGNTTQCSLSTSMQGGCAKLAMTNRDEMSETLTLTGENGTKIADLNVSYFLENCGLKQLTTTQFDLRPVIFDDVLRIRELADVEGWKKSEMEKYKSALEVQRQTELEILHQDWMERRSQLESELLSNIDRAKRLARELKKNAHAAVVNRILEQRCDDERDFTEMCLHKNTVQYSTSTPEELIEKITELECECVMLRDLINEQYLEMQDMRKSALTGEQTQNLIRDLKEMERKYEAALRDKTYFKTEWDKAVKEIHQLKLEDHANIRNKIELDKAELSHLSLERFFYVED